MFVGIKRFIKKCIPPILYQRIEASRKRLPKMRCPVCNSRVYMFGLMSRTYLDECDRYQVPLSPFTQETFNIFDYHCPECGASDRVRLYVLYLERWLASRATSDAPCVLDIAPDPALTKFFRENCRNVRYRSADLYNPQADDRVDVMDMHIYPDHAYDLVICSHVLEHVRDDHLALKEIHRIMKPDAEAIIMVPLDLSKEAIDEDPSIIDEAGRWRRFGQGDHVRAYSKNGFLQRLAENGFRVRQYGEDFFGAQAFKAHGINMRSVLYVVEKL